MKNFPLLFCLVLIFALSAFAQDNQTLDCPTIDVRGSGVPRPNESTYFTADVDKKGKELKIEYLWTVSSGKIVEGQGTKTIAVKVSNSGSPTATVEIKGFPEGCPNMASESSIWDPNPQPRLFDEYGLLTDEDFKTRFQNLFVELRNDPAAQGYLIIYGTKKQIARREKLIRDGLAFLQLDFNRLTLVKAGANPRGKAVWTKVWIVPPGADNPTPDM